MITFEHVYKTYPAGIHALKNLELDIEKGEFAFLMGPSGAGKSTIFKMISCFDKPTSGLVKVCGQNINELNAETLPYFRRKIGVVFQDFKLLNDRNILENVTIPLKILRDRESLIQRKGIDILDRMGLAHRKDDFPLELSGGEQQRVAIARALIHQPGVLIADEPTGNLDPELSEEILKIFEEINAQGTTVFIATHDHYLVSKRQKRVIHIKDGSIVRDSKNERSLARL